MKRTTRWLFCVTLSIVLLLSPFFTIEASASSDIELIQIAVSHLQEEMDEVQERLDAHLNEPTTTFKVTNGNLYVSYNDGASWTSLGNVTGPAGEDGQDGKTPQLRINGQTNYWEVSYDEGLTWVSLKTAATGADGKNGTDGKDGINVQDSNGGNIWQTLTLVLATVSFVGMTTLFILYMHDRRKN